jgi:DNA-binding response OmpR family regulator
MIDLAPVTANSPIILIVDDTPTNLGVVVESLENRGLRLLVAQDGIEGLQRAAFVKPDLILLDVMMPGLDGFEVCRRLKANAETADIPVIFMTALAETEHKITGLKAGGVDYITKPMQIDEVIARVGTHLN